MEVSPLLANDPKTTIDRIGAFKTGETADLFVKIPGTPARAAAIEAAICAGVPVNVTLLFSDDM